MSDINETFLAITVVAGVIAVSLRLLIRLTSLVWAKQSLGGVLRYVDVGFAGLVVALVTVPLMELVIALVTRSLGDVNINRWLLSFTVRLFVAAIGLRILIRTSGVQWIKRWLMGVLEYVDVGLSALVIALAVRSAIAEPFKIPSGSMENTLLIGDHLFVNRFLYGQRIPRYFDRFFPSLKESRPFALRDPRRGDVVVFVPPHKRDTDFIKRVVGLPGDRIEIRNQVVYVNGERLSEEYVVHKDHRSPARLVEGMDNMAETVVPEGKYFVMGDNRDRSQDSRFWGFVSFRDIKGKAMFIYFSWNHDPEVSGLNPLSKIRWSRIGDAIR